MRVERVRRQHDGRGFVHFVIVMGVGRLRRRFGRLVMVLGEVRAQRQRFGGTDDFQDLRATNRAQRQFIRSVLCSCLFGVDVTFSWVLFSLALTSACWSVELTSATSFDGAETLASCVSVGSGSGSNTSVTVCAKELNINISIEFNLNKNKSC